MIENRVKANGSAYLSLMSYLADIRSKQRPVFKVEKSTAFTSGFYARASNNAILDFSIKQTKIKP